MRVYWERIGVLGPIYGLVGQGFNDFRLRFGTATARSFDVDDSYKTGRGGPTGE
jgi:hypothetical protein